MGESGRMVPLFGAALGLAVCEKRWKKRAVLLAVVGLLSIGAVINLHRGPWLGVIAAGFTVICFRSKRALWALPVIIAVLLVMITAYATLPLVKWRVGYTITQATEFESVARVNMWRAAPEIISEYPHGVGQKNADEIQQAKIGTSRHFHSNFVNIAIESGILALIIWAWWMLAFLRMSYDTWKRVPEEAVFEKGVCLGAMAATVGFLVAGLFEYNSGDSEIAMMIYFLMGCVLLVRQGLSERSGSDNDATATVAGMECSS
jgi:O-antigen ligase